MKKILSLALIGCASVALLAGCKKEEAPVPTVALPPIIETQETLIEEVVEETIDTTIAPDDEQTEQNVEQENKEQADNPSGESSDIPSAVSLVTTAYNKMMDMDYVQATSKSTSSSNISTSTLLWENKTGRMKLTSDYQSLSENKELIDGAAVDARHETSYLVCEDGIYIEYNERSFSLNGEWTTPTVSRHYYDGDVNDEFRELFSCAIGLAVQNELVELNGRPHYYLTPISEEFEGYNMYIDSEELTVSRLEQKDTDFEFTLDFEEVFEGVVVPEDILKAAANTPLGDKPDAKQYTIMPPLGSEQMSDSRSLTVGGVTLTIGNTMDTMLNAQFDGWECVLDAYYDEDGYITDDGGKVPAGAYACYYLESDDEDFSGIVVVYAVNKFEQESDIEDCIISGFMHIYSTEYIYGRPLTLLDACVSLGDNYEILNTSYGGGVLQWTFEDYLVMAVGSVDEINWMYVVNEDMYCVLDEIKASLS